MKANICIEKLYANIIHIHAGIQQRKSISVLYSIHNLYLNDFVAKQKKKIDIFVHIHVKSK